MGDASFVDRFDDARRFGTYLRIIDEGVVAANDAIDVLDVPAHGLTVADIANAYSEKSDEQLQRLIAVEAVPADWREWAERALARRS
jgi:MOSC domain-containing protein YiiM